MVVLKRGMKVIFIFISIVVKTSFVLGQSITSSSVPQHVLITSSFLSPISELKVGDEVPNFELQLLNGNKIHIADFKNKFVILDFWATWCGSCVSKFPLLDSLQKQYNDQLQIILVNTVDSKDTPEEIARFFKKLEKVRGHAYKLMVAVNDSIASKYFPHAGVPHYVWISKGGYVTGITSGASLNQENITKFLSEKSMTLPTKKDFFINKLIVAEGEISDIDESLAHYSLFRKGKLNSMKRTNGLRIIKNKENNKREYIIRGKTMVNMPLVDMYKEAINYHPVYVNDFTIKRLIVDSSDERLIYNPATTDKKSWEQANFYVYDLVIPIKDSANLYQYILDDLNRFSGFYGQIIKKKVECFEIVRTSKADKIKSKGGPSEFRTDHTVGRLYVKYCSLNQLARNLEIMPYFRLPVVNATGYNGNVDLELDIEKVKDYNQLRTELLKYDLDIVKNFRDIEVFEIVAKEKQSSVKRGTDIK